jgi:cytoskeletal protein CcmA (bactofilin family)
MSFSSKVLYTGNGAQSQYTITFPFISSSHVSVYLNEVLQLEPLNYTRSGSVITFNSIPEQDDAIVIQRWTSPITTLVDFVDGSTLRADDLDTAYLHNFYLSQEYADSFNELINETLVNIATGAGILETETDDIINALVAEMLDKDAAATLQQRVTDIDNNAEAILSLTDSLQVQINTLAQGVAANVYLDDDAPVPGEAPYPDPIAEGSRWYDTNDNNKPYIYQSSAWVSIEDPRIGSAVADIALLQTNVAENYSAILAEQFAQATETFALAQSLSIIGAQSGDGSAFIIDLDSVKIDSDQGVSLAARFSTVESDIGTNAASITTEASTRATADSAIATTFSLLGAENGGQTAFILDEDTVKIASDGGQTVAERFSTLVASDDANAASITTIQTVDLPAIEAEYGVDVTVNGYVSGFRLINGGTPGDSAFVILADKFAIVDPSGDPGETEYVPMQIVGGKVRFNANVEIDGNLMVSGTIQGGAIAPGGIGQTQIGSSAITTGKLNAQAVTTAKLQANAVTAAKISVTDLAAISADLGAITAGSIVVDSSGFIRGGQTAYNTGNGFWLGYDSTVYKFSIGDTDTNSLTWDGTTLSIRGDLELTPYVSGGVTLAEALTERNSGAADNNYVKIKEFTIARNGVLKFTWSWKVDDIDVGYTKTSESAIQIIQNAVVLETFSPTITSSYASKNDTITITDYKDGNLEVWVKARQQTREDPADISYKATYVKNCRLKNLYATTETTVTD